MWVLISTAWNLRVGWLLGAGTSVRPLVSLHDFPVGHNHFGLHIICAAHIHRYTNKNTHKYTKVLTHKYTDILTGLRSLVSLLDLSLSQITLGRVFTYKYTRSPGACSWIETYPVVRSLLACMWISTGKLQVKPFSNSTISPAISFFLLHPGRLMSWQGAPHWKCQDPSTDPTNRWSASCVTGDSRWDGTFGSAFLPHSSRLPVTFCRFGRFLVGRVHWRAKAEFCWRGRTRLPEIPLHMPS